MIVCNHQKLKSFQGEILLLTVTMIHLHITLATEITTTCNVKIFVHESLLLSINQEGSTITTLHNNVLPAITKNLFSSCCELRSPPHTVVDWYLVAFFFVIHSFFCYDFFSLFVTISIETSCSEKKNGEKKIAERLKMLASLLRHLFLLFF